MPKFVVEVTETYKHQETVEAKNKEEAIRIIKTKYWDEELVLNDVDFISTEFDVIEKVKECNHYAR